MTKGKEITKLNVLFLCRGDDCYLFKAQDRAFTVHCMCILCVVLQVSLVV
jgi:hypothetical protein